MTRQESAPRLLRSGRRNPFARRRIPEAKKEIMSNLYSIINRSSQVYPSVVLTGAFDDRYKYGFLVAGRRVYHHVSGATVVLDNNSLNALDKTCITRIRITGTQTGVWAAQDSLRSACNDHALDYEIIDIHGVGELR